MQVEVNDGAFVKVALMERQKYYKQSIAIQILLETYVLDASITICVKGLIG